MCYVNMLCVVFLILGFTYPACGQNNQTSLEGWKYDDNTRSSWDILWTCLSAILACTWTALHIRVPKRTESAADPLRWKTLTWIVALIAPEIIAVRATSELLDAKHTAMRCNLAFQNFRIKSQTTSKELSASPWNTTHGFCVNMRGVILQTKDGWTYPINDGNITLLANAGVIKDTDIRARDINDRAKADSFAKGFSIIQSGWVACNVIARRVYDLPISAIEISTVAYVVCAAATYILWWNKPKDMVTRFIIPLQYDREGDDMPAEIRCIVSKDAESWIHCSRLDSKDSVGLGGALSILLILLFFPFVWVVGIYLSLKGEFSFKIFIADKLGFTTMLYQRKVAYEAQRDPKEVSRSEEISREETSAQLGTEYRVDRRVEVLSLPVALKLYSFMLASTLLFCGIHVAA
ncbi:hypothetical protein N7533_011008 [Penicillium manginii]|uniref:uncharacterized protein n=1 Tax=Penicillium manginii TaxID=203109 RepID=UPI0025470848|nr:uncharacterized protein N7533_011008 [Penicillium manginii]KAJ5741599.1 hypothetical protein N7533_011008 [Penicillium manginii]